MARDWAIALRPKQPLGVPEAIAIGPTLQADSMSSLATETTAAVHIPTPTPSTSAGASHSTETFEFAIIANMTTCEPATIRWSYSGHSNGIALLLSRASSSLSQRDDTGTRGVIILPIAYGLDAAAQNWTWPLVNVSAGWYILEAAGNGVMSMSSQFFIYNGTDTGCLSPGYAPLRDTTHSTATASTLPCAGMGCFASGDAGAVLGYTLGGVLLLAAAVYAAYRFLILPTNGGRRVARRQYAQQAEDMHPVVGRLSTHSDTNPHSVAEKLSAASADTTNRVSPILPPLPAIPHLSLPHPPMPSTPPRTDAPPPDAPLAAPPRPRTRSHPPLALTKLDTDLARAHASPRSNPTTQRSTMYATDQSDAGSSVWPRRYSTASSWDMMGPSRRSSPCPSSATDQMYRVRDSARSAWAFVRPWSVVDEGSLSAGTGSSAEERSGNAHRKAASFDGLRSSTTPRSASGVVPEVPPLPEQYRTLARKSLG